MEQISFLSGKYSPDESVYYQPEIYRKLSERDCSNDSCVLHFLAGYEYLHAKDNDKAFRHINDAIYKYEHDNYSFNCDARLYVIDKKMPDMVFHIRPAKMYLLAAELYAEKGELDKSVNMYHKYYFHSHTVKPHNSLKDRDSVVLYTFRPCSKYSFYDILKNQITFSHPDKMNDPFDSIANYIGKKERLELVCKKKLHVVAQSESFKQFFIRSFVANRTTYADDDSILQRMPMWAHYADNHSGYCLKYKLSKDYFHAFDIDKLLFTRLMPVEYTNVATPIEIDLNTDNSFAMKHNSWEYESEVRLLHFDVEADEGFHSIPLDNESKLDEIIFGYNCTKATKEIIDSFAPKGCRLFELVNDDRTNIYSLKKQEYCRK